jgi:hypothetical protein
LDVFAKVLLKYLGVEVGMGVERFKDTFFK